MPPKSDPRREEAKRLYLDSNGRKSLQQIATELGVPKSTVSSWKVRGEWAAELKSSKRKPRTRKKGRRKEGYYGNQNAAGPRADVSGYIGNKNALRHGRYEEIKYATLTEEERELMEASVSETSDVDMLTRLVAELEVKEMRMMRRIEEMRQRLQEDEDAYVPHSASVEQKGSGKDLDKSRVTIKKTKVYSLERIQEYEVNLLAVQRQKRSTIMDLHRLAQDMFANSLDLQRLELERQRVEIASRRLALLDPDDEPDALKRAKELLGGVDSAI